MHVGENMWTGGDQLATPETRNGLAHVHQPLTMVIEQQDEETWWVLLSAAHHLKPTPWMRRFVHAFHECVLLGLPGAVLQPRSLCKLAVRATIVSPM
ncbi:unnamed protein product [Symbiodinium microadriaticum]|nr:unnamed protein product [Symbiodinium microadriaticum]